MGYRSARDTRTEDDSQSSRAHSTTPQTRSDTASTDAERTATPAQQSAAHRSTTRTAQRSGRVSVGRQESVERLQEHYGIEIQNEEVLQRLVHTERVYGERVHDWIDEGMPVSAMGNQRAMAAFRDRQQDRPAEVPADIERQNEYSVQRNRRAGQEPSPAGQIDVPERVREVISSPGQALDSEVQEMMEQRMDESFGDVRIHTGAKAASACESINARAFTVGNHVAFNRGEYDPGSPEGQHVLAHELAHVRQQTGGALSMLPQEDLELEIDPDPHLEQEAEETANRVMVGAGLGVQRLAETAIHVQRIPNWALGDPPNELFTVPESLQEHPIKNKPARFGEANSTDYRRNFFKSFPQLKQWDGFVVHHAVEQHVQDAYPGVVSDEEMHSVENLRGIPPSINPDLHLSEIRIEWNRFYRNHDYYTEDGDVSENEISENEKEIKQDLLDKATEIDDTYGQYFAPLVRDNSSYE